MSKTDISFNKSLIFDFIGCMERIADNDKLFKNVNESNQMLHVDKELADWITNFINNVSPEMAECFKFFFDREIPFGTGILKIAVTKNISSIDELISVLKDMDSNKLLMYFINCDDNFASHEDIQNIRDSQASAYKYIDKTFPVSIENKWRILTLINEPETCKQKFIAFIQKFYDDYYSDVKEKAVNFINAGAPGIIDYISEDPVNRAKELSLMDIKEESETKIVIGFSYFIDLGVSIVDDSKLNLKIVTIGIRRLERLHILGMDHLTDEQMIGVCNVLGDKTRIAILKMLKEGPVYGSLIAEKFGISNPAASYHLEQFMTSGLVTVQKEGHRLYFYLKDERVEQVIKYLRDLVNHDYSSQI